MGALHCCTQSIYITDRSLRSGQSNFEQWQYGVAFNVNGFGIVHDNSGAGPVLWRLGARLKCPLSIDALLCNMLFGLGALVYRRL